MQRPHFVDVDVLLGAEGRDDDGQADRGLRGGNGDDEEGKDVPRVLRPRARANATSSRFAALNISSMDISMMSGLRRTITPATPMKNMTEASAT